MSVSGGGGKLRVVEGDCGEAALNRRAFLGRELQDVRLKGHGMMGSLEEGAWIDRSFVNSCARYSFVCDRPPARPSICQVELVSWLVSW